MFRLGVVAVFSGGCWCFQEELVDRVLICDLDVHQGDGTAEILKERQVDVKKAWSFRGMHSRFATLNLVFCKSGDMHALGYCKYI